MQIPNVNQGKGLIYEVVAREKCERVCVEYYEYIDDKKRTGDPWFDDVKTGVIGKDSFVGQFRKVTVLGRKLFGRNFIRIEYEHNEHASQLCRFLWGYRPWMSELMELNDLSRISHVNKDTVAYRNIKLWLEYIKWSFYS